MFGVDDGRGERRGILFSQNYNDLEWSAAGLEDWTEETRQLRIFNTQNQTKLKLIIILTNETGIEEVYESMI